MAQLRAHFWIRDESTQVTHSCGPLKKDCGDREIRVSSWSVQVWNCGGLRESTILSGIEVSQVWIKRQQETGCQGRRFWGVFYSMQSSTTSIKFDMCLCSAFCQARTVKWLSNIADKMDQVFQCVGTLFAMILIANTLFEDAGLIDKGLNNTSLLRGTITRKVDHAVFGGPTHKMLAGAHWGRETGHSYRCNAILHWLEYVPVYLPNWPHSRAIHGSVHLRDSRPTFWRQTLSDTVTRTVGQTVRYGSVKKKTFSEISNSRMRICSPGDRELRPAQKAANEEDSNEHYSVWWGGGGTAGFWAGASGP